MHLKLGSNSDQSGIFHAIDPRARIVVAVAFAFVCVLSDSFPALLVACSLSVSMAAWAKLGLLATLKRLAAMDMFMLYLLVFLPFSIPGESMLQIFGFSASWEGLDKAIKITLKANAVVLMLFASISNLSMSALGSAMSSLKVPNKLIQLLLFTTRYLSVINEEYRRLRRSMQARAFVMGFNWHSWKTIGYLIGMLLVRSMDRSQRILNAMKCRGFNGVFISYYPMHWQRLDWIYCTCISILLVAISLLNYFSL
jgi:cobalt/nickel transport system permease protein